MRVFATVSTEDTLVRLDVAGELSPDSNAFRLVARAIVRREQSFEKSGEIGRKQFLACLNVSS